MPTSTQTFLFVDLAGFTALTESHGDAQAADLAGEFCEAVGELLPDHGAETVKTIGDAVMVRVEDPLAAVELALRIVRDIGGRHGIPSVRVGMHTGPAVERDGDWFGATVNVAARVSALARGAEVLLTEETLSGAGALIDIDVVKAGPQRLKNVAEPVAVYRAVPRGGGDPSGRPVDPVCRMTVEPSLAAGTLLHDGTEYVFCSMACASAFAAEPERHIAAQPSDGLHDAAHAPASTVDPDRAGRVIATVQGAAYVYFGLWSLLARDHYRAVHRRASDDWLLNAHAGWLTLVGGQLVKAGARGRVRALGAQELGLGAAGALAANDALLARRTPRIYAADFAFETSLACAWALRAYARRQR